MIAEVLQAGNLYSAAQQVVLNKRASGVDGMSVSKLVQFKRANRDQISTSIHSNSYTPSNFRGIHTKGKGENAPFRYSHGGRQMLTTGRLFIGYDCAISSSSRKRIADKLAFKSIVDVAQIF